MVEICQSLKHSEVSAVLERFWRQLSEKDLIGDEIPHLLSATVRQVSCLSVNDRCVVQLVAIERFIVLVDG